MLRRVCRQRPVQSVRPLSRYVELHGVSYKVLECLWCLLSRVLCGAIVWAFRVAGRRRRRCLLGLCWCRLRGRRGLGWSSWSGRPVRDLLALCNFVASHLDSIDCERLHYSIALLECCKLGEVRYRGRTLKVGRWRKVFSGAARVFYLR